MAKIGLEGAQAVLDQHGSEHMQEIGRNGYYTVMQRYGVERPLPPISLNERRWMAEHERAQEPAAEQGALFTLDDLRKTA
jgi:hypothetical protein